MTRQTQSRLPRVPCDGPDCASTVRQTRPSMSGRHYCSRKPCQAAKIKAYRDEQAKVAVSEEKREFDAVILDIGVLFHTALHGERQQCPECGLMNAIRGWPHPDRSNNPCLAIGQMRPSCKREILRAVWPEVTRKYAE